MPANTVTFSFRPSADPERREAVLGDINSWEDVSQAGLLKPDAKREHVRLMAYASVAGDADAEELVKRLSELPEVEPGSVAAATPRRLV
jgi:hypothetical protein